jgi:hypothetical protein
MLNADEFAVKFDPERLVCSIMSPESWAGGSVQILSMQNFTA